MSGPIFTGGGAQVDQTYLQNWPASLRQTLAATFEEGVQTSWPARLNEWGARNLAENAPGAEGFDSPVIGQEEAKTRVKDLNLDLEIPEDGVKQYVLDRMITRKYEEKVRRSVLDRGPDSGWAMAARFGTGVAASLLDPVNIAAAFIPIVGPARYASMLRGAAGPLGRSLVRGQVGAVEGFVGSAAIEPASYLLSKQLQDDYTWRDSLLNVAFGTVLGGGMHMGVGAISDAVAKGRPWWEVEPQGEVGRALQGMDSTTRENALKTAIAQAAEGRPIDVEPVIREALWERVQRAVAEQRAVEEAWAKPGFQRTADDLVTLRNGITEADADPLVRRAVELLDQPRFLLGKEDARFIRDLEAGRLDPKPDAYAAARDNHAPTAGRDAEVKAGDEVTASVKTAEPSGHVEESHVAAEQATAMQERALVEEQAKEMGVKVDFESVDAQVAEATGFAKVMQALALCQVRS